MNIWQLAKELAKGAGFYTKQFIFFFLLALAGVILVFALSRDRFQAQESLINEEAYTGAHQTFRLDITDKGQIIKNNKTVGQVELGRDKDAVRYKVVDKPGYFVDSLSVTLHFNQTLNIQETEYKVIATHYDTGEDSYVAATLLDPHTIVYTGQGLSPDTIFTVYTRFPKGIIHPPFWRVAVYKVTHLPVGVWLGISIALPLLTLLSLLAMFFRYWYANMRLYTGPPTAKIPSNLPPAIVGVLIHGRIGAREIAATIIDLAGRDYIHIYEDGQNFYFGRGRALESEELYQLYPFERYLLAKIFTARSFKSSSADISVRLGQQLFSQKMARVFVEIYNLVSKYGYFVQNPGLIHQRHKTTGLGLLLAGLGGFILNAIFNREAAFLLFFWVGMMAASLLIIYLSPFMPTLTKKGREIRRQWLGFERYLAQNKNVEYHDELINPYTEYLPYAIVLGIESSWTRRCLPEPFYLPQWFGSKQPTSSLEDFANNLLPLIGYISKELIASRTPVID